LEAVKQLQSFKPWWSVGMLGGFGGGGGIPSHRTFPTQYPGIPVSQ